MKKIIPALLCLLAIPCLAGEGPVDRRIVLTFDDLPAQRHQAIGTERMGRLNAEILAALEEAPGGPIPAIAFVNESKLEVEGGDGERRVENERVEILERWLDAGMELGNHTYSHPDLHRISLEDFERDTLRGEARLRPLLATRGQTPRYFRHPFLHTGRSLETKRAFESFLERHGYEVAPVTVDNGEWIYARAYDRILDGEGAAAAEPGLRDRLVRSYLEYMSAMVEFYEGQSRALFGREIPQVLLLHANDLNGDHVGELIRRLDQRGYRFVALEEALEHPAYDSPDTYVGPGGITWLHRWAITKNVDRSMFRGEPEVPAWVRSFMESGALPKGWDARRPSEIEREEVEKRLQEAQDEPLQGAEHAYADERLVNIRRAKIQLRLTEIEVD